MALTFQELLLDSGSGTGGAAGLVNQNVRRFQVPGNTPEAALLQGDLLAEAGRGIPHPRIPLLLAASAQVGERIGSGDSPGYIVEVGYNETGAGQFEFPAPPRQELAFKSAGFSFWEDSIPLPIWDGEVITAINVNGNSVPQVQYRLVDTVTIPVQGIRFQIEFNLQTMTGSEIGLIRAQAGKLHSFYGGQWLFRPQYANTVIRDKVWSVTYQWIGEEGTPQSVIDEVFEDIGTAVIPTARPPHARWYAYPIYDPFVGVLTKGVRAVVPFPSVPTGYQSLPGYGTQWNL